MERGEGFVFQHKPDSPSGWTVIMYSGLVGLALIILSLALFALASSIGVALISLTQYVGVFIIILGSGQFIVCACKGTAMIIEAQGRAKALEAEAQTRRIATMRQKPLLTEWTVKEDDDVRR